MLVLLFLTGPLQFLPVCVLGAIVFTIAVRLVDVKGLRELHRKSPGEWVLALVTTGAVVLFGVEDGIILALVLSLLQHVRHSYQPPAAVETQAARRTLVDERFVTRAHGGARPHRVLVWVRSILCQTSIVLLAKHINWSANLDPP